MNNKFKDIARRALKSNTLNDLTRIKTDDLIAKHPDCVSITGVVLVEYAGDSYPAFTFAEDTTKYFTGGMALRNMVNAWLDEDPTLAEVNEEFKANPLRVRMKKIRTKSGNTFTSVEILDDDEEDIDPDRIDAETGEIIGDPF